MAAEFRGQFMDALPQGTISRISRRMPSSWPTVLQKMAVGVDRCLRTSSGQ